MKLACPMEIKKLESDGEFEGYASVFNNVDLGYDVVMPGAFKKKDMALTKDGQIRVLYQHNQDQPIGKARIDEDEKGLHFTGRLVLENPVAKTAHAMMKEGILDGMSIGYDAIDSDFTEGGVRRITKGKLWEISLVTFGMNPKARVEAVKAINEFKTIRELESALRDGDRFSAALAKKIAAIAWPAMQEARDETEGKAVVEQVLGTIGALKFPPINIRS
jgi:HK97 family phage prohead protease